MNFDEMRKFFLKAVLVLLIPAAPLFSQDEEEEELDPMRFYKAKYDLKLDAPLDIVDEATVEALEELNCFVIQNKKKTDNDGYGRYIVKSDFCVFVEGDPTFDTLQYYSKQMPFIRGGTWKNGRMQYKFVITEKPDGTIYVLLKGSLSGFENNITNKVHFWESNGMFEHYILLAIEEKVKQKTGTN